MKRKVTGEGKMFKEIAAERQHICFITHTLVRAITPWNCAHVLGKGMHKCFTLYPDNVILVQDWVHDIMDKGDITKLHKYPGFADYIALKERLQSEYSKLSVTQRKAMIAANKEKYGVKD